MPTNMAEIPALLRLMTWLSPAFPTGGFAYSHGIEWAVEAGDVRCPRSAQAWIADILIYGSGKNDALLLRAAYRACDDPESLFKIASLARAISGSAERLLETEAQGTAFSAAALPWGGIDSLPYPVAVGALAGRYRIAEDDAVLAYLHALSSNFVSAAMRLIPLGQSQGLEMLAALEPILVQVCSLTRALSLEDLGGACFRSDIASMKHETQYTRLFRT
jgi:urease accessory protein